MGGSEGSSNTNWEAIRETSWEAVGETSSIGSWETSSIGKTSREGVGSGKGSSDWGSIFNAGNNLGWCSSIDTMASKETSSIGVDNDGCGILSLTLLPLLSRSRSSSGISSSGISSRGNSRCSGGNRQVGGRDSESIDRVSNVLGSLEE